MHLAHQSPENLSDRKEEPQNQEILPCDD
jgi:hypothetical protein